MAHDDVSTAPSAQEVSNDTLASRLYRMSHIYDEKHPNYETVREAARRLSDGAAA